MTLCPITNFGPKTGSKKRFWKNHENCRKRVISTTFVPIFRFLTPLGDSKQAKNSFCLMAKNVRIHQSFYVRKRPKCSIFGHFLRFLTPLGEIFEAKGIKDRLCPNTSSSEDKKNWNGQINDKYKAIFAPLDKKRYLKSCFYPPYKLNSRAAQQFNNNILHNISHQDYIICLNTEAGDPLY